MRAETFLRSFQKKERRVKTERERPERESRNDPIRHENGTSKFSEQ